MNDDLDHLHPDLHPDVDPHLHRRLDDLLVDVPRRVQPDARAAWARGTRRRRAHRAGAAAVALVAVLLVALGAAQLPGGGGVAPATTRGAGVDGYPTRLDHAWWARDLPDTPGPVAAVVERVDDGADGSSGWYAVSPTGRLWRIPGTSDSGSYPALSPDGTMLGYLDDAVGHYRTRDLTTGAVADFPTYVSSQGTRDPARTDGPLRDLGAQLPSWWSPDATRVAVYDGHVNLLGPGTEVVRLRRPAVPDGIAMPVGWVDDTHLGWLGWVSTRPGLPAGTRVSATYVVTDDRGRVAERVPLVLDAHLVATLQRNGAGFDQWTGSLSPDGRVLALQTTSDLDDLEVALMSTTTGRRVLGVDGITDAEPACGLSWSDRSPVVAVARDDGTLAVRGPPRSARALVRADPRLGIGCTSWASDALAGRPHRGLTGLLFRTSPSAFAWWWRETTLALLVVAGLLVVVRVRRRRRRRDTGEGAQRVR